MHGTCLQSLNNPTQFVFVSEILNIDKWHHYNTTCVIYLNKEMSSRVHLFMDGENYIKCITTIYKHIDVYYVYSTYTKD